MSSDPVEPVTEALSTLVAQEEPKKPKKQATVVYEGDPRWQGPKGIQSDDEDDEDIKKEGDDGETVDSGDLLADYPDDTEEIQLLHSRIANLSELRLPRFSKSLKSLCLRQNNISHLDPDDFEPLQLLEELDIYDNQVKDLGFSIKGMKNLKTLDLSFNLLRAVPPVVDTLPALSTVFFVQNKITRIDGLQAVGASLRSLELGGNRIRTIENLDALVNLEELWLGKNKITKLENLGALKKLRLLALPSNRITTLEGLDELTELEEFYISHNGVERLQGLEHNLKLSTLDVGNNQIPEIENLSHLKSLEELWLNDNQIPNILNLDKELAETSTLQTIYLEGNPCQKNDAVAYRRKVKLALPQVRQIDATYARLPA